MSDYAPPPPKRPQRRSPTPGTLAFIVFIVLAMLRMLVFRPESELDPESKQPVTVIKVIDGDTIELTDGRTVRLLGIDAPEAGFFGKVAEPWSKESTQWLRSQIDGKQIRLRIDSEEKDRYQRTLAWVYTRDGEFINERLLSEGHAKLLADYGLPLDLEPRLRAAESEARIEKRGLWGVSRRSTK
jgi:micrococcal nuclease